MNRNKVQDTSNQTKDHFKYTPEELSDLIESNSASILNNDFGGVHAMVDALRTNTTSGLCDTVDNSFKDRVAYFGTNTYPVPPAKNIIVMFFENLNDLSLIILIVFSVVSIALGLAFPDRPEDRKYGWVEGFAILVAVIIVSGVSSINDWNKDRKFRSLSKESKKILISVTRQDKQIEVLIDEIMVGDIVHLRTGDQVPADGLYLSGFDLKTDESAVTGETDLIKKKKDAPFLRSGTQVAEGGCDMLVLAVGVHSQWGKALAMIAKGKMDDEPQDQGKELSKEEKRRKEEAESDETPLEMKLNGLSTSIGKVGILAGILTTGVLVIGWAVRKVIDVNRGEQEWSKNEAIQIVNFIVIGVTITVVAIPEGLPLAVTISLAYSVREMLLDNNLVRHLSACETMGGATNICSDKTGTLTLNQMNVVQGYFGGKDYKDAIPQLVTSLNPGTTELLIEGIVVNSKVTVTMNEEKKEEPKSEFYMKMEKIGILLGLIKKPKVRKNNPEDRWRVVGSKTEGALVLMLIKHFNKTLVWPEEEMKRRTANHSIGYQFSFSSKKKRMSTIIRLDRYFEPHSFIRPDVTRTETFKYRFYAKGASEILLEDCTHFLNESGRAEEIDQSKRKEFIDCIERMANQGLRTLCLAYRDYSKTFHPRPDLKHDFDHADAESIDGYVQDPREREYFETVDELYLCKKMIMIAIVGIKDPLRDEVPAAVETCKKAGIIVRMITGDNILTAKHIARECGILTPEGMAIEGPVFRKMHDDELKKILPRLQVMARSSPADKYRLVTKLREMGEVVAVTGDGTNDGPALKAADVGLAMGLSGTQVAKEASDIIILDDNFDSIVQSVKWGRCVFENIRKFLLFQITVNIVALVLTVITAITTFIIGKRDEKGTIKYEPPLTAIQLLWVNLIMDTFAALALATEKPTDDLLLRKPYGRRESLISKKMWAFMLVQSFYQLLVLLIEYYLAEKIGVFKWEKKHSRIEGLNRTLVFNTFVFLQFFNQFNARKINFEFDILSGIFHSPWFIVVSVITLVLQVVFVNVEGPFTQTTRLDWHHWLISLGLAFMCIPIGFATRAVARLVLYLVNRSKEKDYVQQWDVKTDVSSSEGYQEEPNQQGKNTSHKLPQNTKLNEKK